MTPADEIERRLRRIYAQAGAELAKKLADFQKKSAERAAKKLKQLQDGKITQEEYASWMRGQIFQTEQWEKKIDQATGTLLDANREALQIVEKEKMGVFAENANYQAFQLTKDAGVALNFAVYDMDTVGRLIREEPELMPRKVVDGKKDKAWNRTQIANAVTQGIIQGEGIPDIAKRIARDTASTNMKAMERYARTAMTEAQNAGRMETLKRGEELGIKCKKCWLATLDSRTRDSHQRMDGKKVDVDEDFVTPLGSRMKYPGDTAGKPGDVWNCRCTMTYEYDGYEGDETERIAYNEYEDEDGKKHRESYLIKDMTYQQWKQMNSTPPDRKPDKTQVEKKVEKAIEKEVEPEKKEEKKQDVLHDLTEAIRNCPSKPTEAELRDVGAKAAKTMEDMRKENGFYEQQESVKKAEAEEHEYFLKYSDAGLAFYKASKDNDPNLDEKREARDKATADYREAEKRTKDARKELEKRDVSVVDLLSKVRQIGGITADDVEDLVDLSRASSVSVKKIKTALAKAFNNYPVEWLAKSGEHRLTLKPVWDSARASYSLGSGVIKVSDRKGSNVHELAHRFEATVPGILKAEKEFYERRTAGEELKWLGPGYDQDEKTRKDKFIDKYMGKDYGGTAYELASMGFDLAFNNYKKLCKDEEYRDFILGILCSV